jgi:hypothetical protein
MILLAHAALRPRRESPIPGAESGCFALPLRTVRDHTKSYCYVSVQIERALSVSCAPPEHHRQCDRDADQKRL